MKIKENTLVIKQQKNIGDGGEQRQVPCLALLKRLFGLPVFGDIDAKGNGSYNLSLLSYLVVSPNDETFLAEFGEDGIFNAFPANRPP